MTERHPHEYVPEGPLDDPPFMGHCPDEIRREAFTAVLAGVDLGAWDLAMISHRVGADDDNELRWMTSLLWRARLAGRAEALEGTPEWGVRFTIGTRTECPCRDEADARDVVANMQEKNPEWDAVLIQRTAARPAGEWAEVSETAKDGDDG